MADQPTQQQQEMTDDEIWGVFETLKLSTEPKPVPSLTPPAAPLVFFTVTGNSPPLNAR